MRRFSLTKRKSRPARLARAAGIITRTMMTTSMSITIITTSILNSLNKEKLTLAYYMSGAVALIASIFFMPKYIGVDSLIAGMFLSYAITSVLNLIAIARVCPEKISVSGYIFKSAIFIIPSFLAGYFVNNLLRYRANAEKEFFSKRGKTQTKARNLQCCSISAR